MRSVSFGNQQAAHIADFKQYHLAGVGEAVGVADVKQIAAAIGITKGGNIFHAWPSGDTGTGRFALSGGHAVQLPETICRILTNCK